MGGLPGVQERNGCQVQRQKNGRMGTHCLCGHKGRHPGGEDIGDLRSALGDREAHRQMKLFQGLEDFKSKKYAFVVFHILMGAVAYNMFNLFLNKARNLKDFKADEAKKAQQIREEPRDHHLHERMFRGNEDAGLSAIDTGAARYGSGKTAGYFCKAVIRHFLNPARFSIFTVFPFPPIGVGQGFPSSIADGDGHFQQQPLRPGSPKVFFEVD